MRVKNISSTSVEKLRNALLIAWSIESSTLWKQHNPAAGQCGVTTLVANDFLGGDIVKTRFRDIWHFYNIIEGDRMDFTKSQFSAPLEYSNIASNRDEAFSDTNASQYAYLKSAVQNCLDKE